MNSQIARVGNTTIFRFPSFRLVFRRLLASGKGFHTRRTSDSRNSAAARFPIARHVLPTSQAGLSNADGGRHGVGTLRPFSRFGYVGQDTGREKSNLFYRPIINLVIPIALVAGRLFHYLTDLRVAAAHDSNRIGEFLSWVTNVLSRTTK